MHLACRVCAVVGALLTSMVLSSGSASADMDCADFGSHAEAQAYFEANGGSSSYNFDLLDADGDGLACELGPGAASSKSVQDLAIPRYPDSANDGFSIADTASYEDEIQESNERFLSNVGSLLKWGGIALLALCVICGLSSLKDGIFGKKEDS